MVLVSCLRMVLVIIALTSASVANAVDMPEGYRMGHYKAPTPESAPGATTVSTQQMREMAEVGDAVFVDVFGATRSKAEALEGKWVMPRRINIPGSTWLPNVGRGQLEEEFERYFRDNLKRLTGGDKNRKIAFYCKSNCWLSWNASKRAHTIGYTSVYWYRDGTDGWKKEGLPLVEATPVPVTAP